MTATIHRLRPPQHNVTPLHRKKENLDPEVVLACHRLWDALEKMPRALAEETLLWIDKLYGIPRSVYDEVMAAKECRDDAQRDLDTHPDPAS